LKLSNKIKNSLPVLAVFIFTRLLPAVMPARARAIPLEQAGVHFWELYTELSSRRGASIL
jgi:hypothetical protein